MLRPDLYENIPTYKTQKGAERAEANYAKKVTQLTAGIR